MARKTDTAVLLPNLGLYLNVPPIGVPKRALQDCLNVRLSNGRIVNLNMGWSRFSSRWRLNSQVTLIENYFDSLGAQKLIFASLTDLYEWSESTDSLLYLTPRYSTGTASSSGTTVTGTGTSWLTGGIKAGDMIHFGSSTQRAPTPSEQPSGPNANWYLIEAVPNATTLTLAASGPTVSAGPYTIRRRLTMDANDVWSTELFHHALPGPADWWAGTNGVDPVMRWDGLADQVEFLPDLGFTCKTLIRWKNMLVYGNLNVAGQRRRTSIRNSAIGQPFDVSNEEANEFIVHDGVDEIIALLTIADNLVIYSLRSITLAAFVGLPELIAFRKSIAGLGALAPNGIVDFGDNHEFLGPDAAYSFDGVSIKETHTHVMREVIRKMSPNRYNQINAHFAEETGEIWWIVPLTTDPDDASPVLAYSEHYLEEVGDKDPTPFTIREMPATATGYFERLETLTWDRLQIPWRDINFRWDDRFFEGAFPFNLFGTLDGSVFTMGTADTQDGAPISSFARFGLRPMIDGYRRGITRRVYPFTSQFTGGSYGLGVKVHTSDQLGTPTDDNGALLFDLTHAGNRFVNPYTPGRFFSVEFGTNGLATVWDLQGYDIDAVPSGERGKGG